MVTNNSCDYSPTQFNTQVGGANGTLTNIAPSATSGVPYISQGAASNPVFGTATVPGGGTGVTSFTAYAVICGGTTSTGALQSIASVGTSGQVLTSNGAGALPTFQTVATSGKLVQQIRSSTVATQTIATAIPFDDTIPQNTEGGEVLTATITPTNASNILLIEATVQFGSGAGNQAFCGIWQDSGANCLAGSWEWFAAANVEHPIDVRYYMVAGTTSATTFRLRAGLNAGNTYINSIAAGRSYGGTLFTSLTVEEIAV